MDLIPVLDVGELTRRCTVLIFVTPDDALPTLYMDGIAPHLKRGDLLVFTSGRKKDAISRAPPSPAISLVTLNCESAKAAAL